MVLVVFVAFRRGSGGAEREGEILDLLAKHYAPPCESCGTKSHGNALCPGCSVVAYCGEACAEVHKARHAEVCGRLAALRKKHSDRPPTFRGRAPDHEPPPAAQLGYFNDWAASEPQAALRDTAAYFVKYRLAIADFAAENVNRHGRGVVLVDVATERFKPLHTVDTSNHFVYLPARAIVQNPRLSLYACHTVLELVQAYNPSEAAVVAFVCGIGSIERTQVVSPVILLHTEEDLACNTIRNLTPSDIVSRDTR
ncbi:hypothetical protein DIPPA_16738 [Diplonema papillatum]|nr:hypothetical protein DIPPA_16738 [Diplonema papillatum]